MTAEGERLRELAEAAGRPYSERDGACICDYNPSTTDGPQEDCPHHGRPYGYWVDRSDALADRVAAAEAAVARVRAHARWVDEQIAAHGHHNGSAAEALALANQRLYAALGGAS